MTQHPNMLILITDQWLDVKKKKKMSSIVKHTGLTYLEQKNLVLI